MACTNIPADIQGCLNIPLIRGDDKDITLTFTDGDGNPIDLTAYEIKMEIGQNGCSNSPLSTKIPGQGLSVSGNQLIISFANDDAVYQEYVRALKYDIAFTIADITQHWIKGQILLTNSETNTWT